MTHSVRNPIDEPEAVVQVADDQPVTEQTETPLFMANDALIRAGRVERRMTERGPCPVEVAARIIGQKWNLQIVNTLIDGNPRRFCELQEALGGVNPGTLTNRLKYLEEIGMIERDEVSAIPPHVEYRLSEMGRQLNDVIREISQWSRRWLCS